MRFRIEKKAVPLTKHYVEQKRLKHVEKDFKESATRPDFKLLTHRQITFAKWCTTLSYLLQWFDSSRQYF